MLLLDRKHKMELWEDIFVDQCSKVVWDLEICKDIDLLKKADRIILYGAGGKGYEVLKFLNDAHINVDSFCDMDVRKWGKCLEGKLIISAFQLMHTEKTGNHITYLIACIQYPKEVLVLLEHMGLQNIRVVTYWGIKIALRANAEYIYGKKSKRTVQMAVEKELKAALLYRERISRVQRLMELPSHVVWIVLPGKTASTSLELRLKACHIDYIKEHGFEYPAHIIGEKYRQIWEETIKEKSKSLKVFTAVREPLSRDYSAFWQVFTEGLDRGALMPFFQKDFQKTYDSYVELIMKGNTIIKNTLNVFSPDVWNDEFEWFDDQIKKCLNIDVFQYPFDREKGYTIIKNEGIELFLFKAEKIDCILDEIRTFVGTTELPVINGNVSEQKWYGLAYAQLRKEVKLPEEYVKHYYDGNHKMDHFYTPEEKSNFLKKWKNNCLF